jgi:HAD superfamily hydrolase (TIGR01509 family)
MIMFGKKRPAAVLWDMDGTLVDSEEYWLSSEQNLAQEFNGTWEAQDGLDLIGMSLYDSTKVMKAKMGLELEPDEIINRLTDDVVAQLAVSIPWRPGAQELLRELKRRGIKTALVTMSMKRMAESVADQIPFKAFDVIVAGDMVSEGKPHPEPYLMAARLLGVAPEDCVAFEDSHTGLSSAEAAGTKAVGVTNIVPLPEKPGRIIWPTLEGVTLRDLRKLF